MEIREERAGDVLVLSPDGDLGTAENSRALEQQLARTLSAGTLFVVLDCRQVGHVTSAAIRVLLLASRKLARTKGRLVLCAMTPKVQRAFSLSGFDRDFAVVAERDDAVRLALEPVAAVESRRVAPREAVTAAPQTGSPAREAPKPEPDAPPADTPADVTSVRSRAPSPVSTAAASAGPTLAAARAASSPALDRTVVLEPRAASASAAVPAPHDAAIATATRLLAALGAGGAATGVAPARPSAAAEGLAAVLLRSLEGRPA